MLEVEGKTASGPGFIKCFIYLFIYFCNGFFKIGVHSMQDQIDTTRHGVTRKDAQKRLQDTENLLRKNLQLKDVC